MRLLLVGDGNRDRAVLPGLLQTILKSPFDSQFTAWKEIRVHRGYERKLSFAIDRARDNGQSGVVALVDRDRAKKNERLTSLATVRQRHRDLGRGMPAALGEADPHAEAWLLDDPVAVREGLGLAKDTDIPSPGPSPKTELHEMFEGCDRFGECEEIDALKDIAAAVRLERCNHSKTTGFDDFVADVRNELAPLVATQQ